MPDIDGSVYQLTPQLLSKFNIDDDIEVKGIFSVTLAKSQGNRILI